MVDDYPPRDLGAGVISASRYDPQELIGPGSRLCDSQMQSLISGGLLLDGGGPACAASSRTPFSGRASNNSILIPEVACPGVVPRGDNTVATWNWY